MYLIWLLSKVIEWTISMLYNMSPMGDHPLLVMPSDDWYHPIHELLLKRERGPEYEAENDITQRSVATLHLLRAKYAPMISAHSPYFSLKSILSASLMGLL